MHRQCWFSRFVVPWFTFGLNHLFWIKYWQWWLIFI
uniref:Uncharacterized protein n=1 Tax=Arundo donax TaxID=35708 RepID=A0A0A9AWK6_ARUDO